MGEPRLARGGWCWWRQVRKEQKGQRQAHWYHARGGWVIGCSLLDQVRPWAVWTIYEDEDGGEWWLETAKIAEAGERIEIAGAPHRFVAARHWDYKPPTEPSAVQTALW